MTKFREGLDSSDRSNDQGIFLMKVVIVFVLLLWLIKLNKYKDSMVTCVDMADRERAP